MTRNNLHFGRFQRDPMLVMAVLMLAAHAGHMSIADLVGLTGGLPGLQQLFQGDDGHTVPPAAIAA